MTRSFPIQTVLYPESPHHFKRRESTPTHETTSIFHQIRCPLPMRGYYNNHVFAWSHCPSLPPAQLSPISSRGPRQKSCEFAVDMQISPTRYREYTFSCGRIASINHSCTLVQMRLVKRFSAQFSRPPLVRGYYNNRALAWGYPPSCLPRSPARFCYLIPGKADRKSVV